ncbi:hypothetical protein BgiMline_029151 [Biomphalaria glabrata]|nr:hypothetical protein BgiMline_025779 [Biomphalaria glabrata]
MDTNRTALQPPTVVDANRGDGQDFSALALAAASLAVSIICLTVCVLLLIVSYIKLRQLSDYQDSQLQDLKRITNDQEYYIDNISRKLAKEVNSINDMLGKLVKTDEFRALQSQSQVHSEILNEVRAKVSEEMNSDIFMISMKLKNLEEKLYDMDKKIEFYEYDKPVKTKSKDNDTSKNIQNNRLFEEILKYRGKIVQLEKREEERNRKIASLEEKIHTLGGILNIKLTEKHVDYSSSIDTGSSTAYSFLEANSPAIFKSLRKMKVDGNPDDSYIRETSVDVTATPVIKFQLPHSDSSKNSGSSDSSDRTLNNAQSNESVV